MPQLDPSVFLSQIFWLFILFGLIYLFIAHSATPKITRVLQIRQARIASDLEEAERLQTLAEQARIAHEKAIKEARIRAISLVADKRNAIKVEMETEYGKLTGKLASDAVIAEEKIITAKNRALDDIRGVSVDICRDVIRSVSGLDLDEKNIAATVTGKFDRMKEQANG